IQIGEQFECYAYTTIAYGRLAAIYLREGNLSKASENTRRFLMLSEQYNHRYYIRFKPLFASVLKFAAESGVSVEFTKDMMSYGGYTTERVFIHTMGSFYIASVFEREKPVKIRTQKARELLAYLLLHRNGVTREQIFSDLWEDSEADITRLFHTRRGEIRRAFESLGSKNPILHEKGVYRLNMEEIICDYDIFRQAADEFRQHSESEKAKKVVTCYTGRYLDNLEALWAESTRLSLEDMFLEAAEALMEYYRNTGERSKAIELLRRTASSYYGHRYEIE
ncbi:MAG: malT, partial [Anaerocolumna sp.]|nr:malT [Anaerocolumna sp.]